MSRGSAILVAAYLITPATAAEMTGAEIKDYVSGKTIYIEKSAASAAAADLEAVYFAADGCALYKTPMGAVWHGTWAIKGSTLCTDWKELPIMQCRRWDKQADSITSINTATGQASYKVVRTARGNAEKLEQ
jgi:hypothetical protein